MLKELTNGNYYIYQIEDGGMWIRLDSRGFGKVNKGEIKYETYIRVSRLEL